MPVVGEVVGAERRVAGEVRGPPAADPVHRPVQASPGQRVPDDQTGDHERGQERRGVARQPADPEHERDHRRAQQEVVGGLGVDVQVIAGVLVVQDRVRVEGFPQERVPVRAVHDVAVQ